MRSWLSLLALGGLAHTAAAEVVTFERAIGWAGELPELTAASAAAEAQRRVPVAGALGPLLLQVGPQLRLAPSDARGIEGTVSIQQPIALARVAGARRAQVDAVADQRAASAAASALDARLAAAAAWIEGWAARSRLEIAASDLELAREVLRVTERGAAAGALLAPEVADARTFVAEIEVARIDAEGRLTEASFRLATVIGLTSAAEIQGDLPAPPMPGPMSAEALVARARAMPRVAARRLAARASRARAAEERAVRSRQLIVGAELSRDAPDGLLAGVTLGLSLPFDRGQREAREAEIDAAVAERDADALARAAASELAIALHEVEHTGELLAKIRDVLVPAAEDAATRRQRAYQAGATTLVELLAAQRTAVAARGRLADARAAHAWARIQAWLLLQAVEGAR
ncbi:MAG: TolC family protein [Kofleriaceae bacterium]